MANLNLLGAVAARALDANGDSVSGALLTVYDEGTTNSVTTYADTTTASPNASPVVGASDGSFGPIYVPAGNYKVDVTTSGGASLPGYPVDNIVVTDDTNTQAVANGGTGATTAAAARANLGLSFVGATNSDTRDNLDIGPSYIKTTELTSGSGATHTLDSKARWWKAVILGGGGAGGGTAAVSSNQASSGVGGNAGDMIETDFVAVGADTTITYTIGSGGAAAAGAEGGDGGDTVCTHNSVVYTAAGGDGGNVGSGTSNTQFSPGPNTNSGSSTGSGYVTPGERSGDAFAQGTTNIIARGGAGGSSKYGQGGVSTYAGSSNHNAGTAGAGYGAGGSGSANANVTAAGNVAGGAGSGGLVLIFEFA